MQKLKLTSIIIAIIATFASCKKDTLKTEELKDAITKNMSMNYHGEQLQYSVKFSRTSEKVIVEGKDAARVKEIVNTNKNAFAYFKSETEIEMYNNVNDYYIRNNMVNNGNRVGVTSTTNSTTGNGGVRVYFYRHADFSTLYQTHYVDFSSPQYSFKMYVYNGSDLANSTYAGYTRTLYGYTNSWVGNTQNDSYSSMRIVREDPAIYNYNFFEVILFQDANYGGKALGIVMPLGQANKDVAHLSDYRKSGLLGTWNDTVSSDYGFYNY